MDERYRATDFVYARQSADALTGTILELVEKEFPDAVKNARSHEDLQPIFLHIKGIVPRLQAAYPISFQNAIPAIDFCETMGVLVRRDMARFVDIEALFGGWIQGLYLTMEGRIQRLRDQHEDVRVYENFSYLGKKCMEQRWRDQNNERAT